MGKRKFRLKHEKNYERKKIIKRHLETNVTQSLAASTSALIIRLPITHYWKVPVPTAAILYSRISQFNAGLPEGWTSTLLTSASHPPMVSLQLIHPSLGRCDISVEIKSDCSWTLYISKEPFELQSLPTAQSGHYFIPTHLMSVDVVLQFLSQLSYQKVCVGNPDEKFEDLLKRHNGIFKDRHGTD